MLTHTEICSLIKSLVFAAENAGMIERDDRIYCINLLCTELRLGAYEDSSDELIIPTNRILDALCEYAVQTGIIEEGVTAHDLFETRLMGILTPRPSTVNKTFVALYGEDPRKATDYFYRLAYDSRYIRKERIERDIQWVVDSEYGQIDISINLSKPEKDPRAIAAARSAPQSGYPKCLLCPENVGFAGNMNAPARQNLRQIHLSLGGEEWLMQYSPYVYYNEHCIVLSPDHVPMKISRDTFLRQLDFVSLLPHYFVGSNADLPIVGGSILSHDHMQGGSYTFPMERADIEIPVIFKDYPDITAGIVRWPLSVIRLRSSNKGSLVELADRLRILWADYTDEEGGIISSTDGIPHNTVTPIARRRGEDYELDIVLRNNLTSDEFPMGIYHPHEDKHNIKKENIGLIEVMGLAILPARLLGEMERLSELLVAGATDEEIAADEACAKHAKWLKKFRNKCIGTPAEIDRVLSAEIGATFVGCLEDSGVYKTNAEGRKYFKRFINYAGGITE